MSRVLYSSSTREFTEVWLNKESKYEELNSLYSKLLNDYEDYVIESTAASKAKIAHKVEEYKDVLLRKYRIYCSEDEYGYVDLSKFYKDLDRFIAVHLSDVNEVDVKDFIVCLLSGQF